MLQNHSRSSAKSSDEANAAESKIHSNRGAERKEIPTCRLTAISSTHSFRLLMTDQIAVKQEDRTRGFSKQVFNMLSKGLVKLCKEPSSTKQLKDGSEYGSERYWQNGYFPIFNQRCCDLCNV